LITLLMSLSWPTSSLAATRGATFLPRAVAGNRRVAVARGHGQHLRRDVLGQAFGQRRRVGVQHLGDAGDLARPPWRLRRGVGAGHQHVDVAAHCTAAVMVFSVEPLSDGVVVFCDDESGQVR
jgi:hypothetical protein